MPFLWLKEYMEELWEFILHMIWRELFKNEADHYNQSTHLIAFVIFSAFCLFSYYENVNDYVVFVLFALWPLHRIMSYMAYKQASYARVSLTLQDQFLIWHYQLASTRQTQRVEKSQIDCLLIEGEAEYQPVWSLFLCLKDDSQLILFSHRDLNMTMQKAQQISKAVGVEWIFAHSSGESPLAESKDYLKPTGDSGWQEKSARNAIQFKRSWKSISYGNIFMEMLENVGTFIFLAILAGVMTRYGYFLNWFLGPKVGLVQPFELYLDLTPSGIIGFFTPDLSWQNILVSVIIAGLALLQFFSLAKSQLVKMKGGVMTYRFGKRTDRISLNQPNQLIMLYEPQPSLLILSQNKTLLLQDFLDESEMVDLYEKLHHQLKS